MTLAEKRIEWKAHFDTWKSSGKNVAEWCREQDINPSQMYYWIQKFDNNTMHHTKKSATDWLSVKMEDEDQINVAHNQKPIFIHFNSISVEVRPGVDMPLLSSVIRVLQNHDN